MRKVCAKTAVRSRDDLIGLKGWRMNTAEDKDEFLFISKNSPGLKGLADTEGLAVALLLDSSISMEKSCLEQPCVC